MSHEVELSDLAETAATYGSTPFLLYAGDDGSARVNHVVVSFDGSGDTDSVEASCTGYGRGVVRTVEAGSQLSLLWPATGPGMFSLIADGRGSIDDSDTLRIAVSSAVLHRPAPVGGETGC